jgi:hypothetical protein
LVMTWQLGAGLGTGSPAESIERLERLWEAAVYDTDGTFAFHFLGEEGATLVCLSNIYLLKKAAAPKTRSRTSTSPMTPADEPEASAASRTTANRTPPMTAVDEPKVS